MSIASGQHDHKEIDNIGADENVKKLLIKAVEA